MRSRVWRRLRWVRKRLGVVLLGLAALTLAATNLDRLAAIWSKHFGPPDELAALEDAVNLPLMPVATSSVVEVELVQSPIDQDGSQVFDVYLKNTSSDDFLLTKVTFGRGVAYTSANLNISGKFFPDSSYTIRAEDDSKRSVALSPPFLLRAHSRAGIRLRFNLESQQSSVSTPIAFEIYDSAGAKIAAVNGLFGR